MTQAALVQKQAQIIDLCAIRKERSRQEPSNSNDAPAAVPAAMIPVWFFVPPFYMGHFFIETPE
jgi:hypothetical protein